MKLKILLLAIFTTESSAKISRKSFISDPSATHSSSKSASSDWSFETHKLTELTGPGAIDLNGTVRSRFGAVAFKTHLESKDMVVSPISSLLPLAKLALGASDAAAVELVAAIGVANKTALLGEIVKIANFLSNLLGGPLKIMSQLFLSDRFYIQESYDRQLKRLFDTGVKRINYANAGNAANTINDWVNKDTGGLIPSVTTASELGYGESLILVNALYFRGKWARSFTLSSTMHQFHSAEGNQQVRLMHSVGRYRYIRSTTLGAQLVEIPFYDSRLSFVLVLPFGSVGTLISKLNTLPELVGRALAKAERRFVNISMPVFRTTTTMRLVEVYKLLGITSIFSRKAEALKYMTTSSKLHVSDAIQKCIVEFNEEGMTSAGEVEVGRPVQVVADHPFYYFVMAENMRLLEGVY